MKTYKYWTLISFVSIAMCLASCSNDEFIEEEVIIDIDEPIEEVGDFVVGIIQDFEDNPVTGVAVTMSVQNIEIGNTVSNSEGRYRIDVSDLEPTSAILSFEKDGFQKVRKLVETGSAKAVNFKMAEISCIAETLPDPIVINTSELITLSGNAYHADGEPAVNSKVWISERGQDIESIQFLDITVIDNEGYWEIIVPKDQLLELRVDLGSECNMASFMEIGPFSDHTIMDDFTGLDKTLTINVLGTAVACDGSELTDGLIRYYINDHFNVQGNFNIFGDDAETFENCYVTCNLDYTHGVLAYDPTSNNYSIVQRSFEEVIDFGNVPVCLPLESSINVQFDGEAIDVNDASHIYKIYEGFFTKDIEATFVIDDIEALGVNGFSLRLNSDSVLEDGKTYNDFYSFTLLDHDNDITYANFDGDFTINEITGGYAIGTINGSIYQAAESWPQATYTSVGAAINITGDFKILVY